MSEFDQQTTGDFHRQIASQLSELYTHREAETLALLRDPERSLPAAVYAALEGSSIAVRQDDGRIGWYTNDEQDPMKQLANVAGGLENFISTDETGHTRFDFSISSEWVKAARGQCRSQQPPLTRVTWLLGLGFLAAALQPEQVTPADLKRHPEETPEQKGYRMAVTALRSIAVNQRRFIADTGTTGRDVLLAWSRGAIKQFLPNASTKEVAIYNDFIIRTQIAKKLFDLVQRPSYTGKQLQEHLALYNYIATQIQKENEVTAEAPVGTPDLTEPIAPNVETDWEIMRALPRKVARIALAEYGHKIPSDEPLPREEELSKREQRLLRLSRLALLWYDGDISRVKIAVRKLGHTKRDEFQIALLEREREDGVTVTTGVAEAGDLALRIFRGDLGFEEGAAEPWLTWEDVFSGNKKDAELLGAKKITHRKNFEKALLEYLFRNPKEKSLEAPLIGQRSRRKKLQTA